jgi:hypothetical protein
MRPDCIDHGQKGNSGGYGTVKVRGKTQYVHRAALARKLGLPIENLDGWALHACDNPRCINPEHLRLGTAQDNSNDMVSRGRSNAASGESSRHALLNWATVEEIRARYTPRCRNNGTRALGREFGVAGRTITDVILYRTWRHY